MLSTTRPPTAGREHLLGVGAQELLGDAHPDPAGVAQDSSRLDALENQHGCRLVPGRCGLADFRAESASKPRTRRRREF